MSQQTIEYWLAYNDAKGYKVDRQRFAEVRARAGFDRDQEDWRGILPSGLPVRGWVEVGK